MPDRTKKPLPGLAHADSSPFPMVEIERCGCCGEERYADAGRAQGLGLRRCTGCGTVRFAAVVDHDHLYDDGYHTGDSPFGWDFDSERPYQLALAHQTLAWIERVVPVGRMVDVGGGLGYFAASAAERGWDATLLEPVAGACAFATATFGLRAVCARADALAEMTDRFDLVALSHTLEHFTRPLEILDEVRGAIAQRGMLYVEVPNFASAAHRLQGDHWYGLQVGQHVHHFTPKTLRGLLERGGYEVVQHDTHVPGWDGLIPASYAHWLGLERAFHKLTDTKRAVMGASGANTLATIEGVTGDAVHDAFPVPLKDMRGATGRVLQAAFPTVARIEETFGAGANVRVLARPRR